MRVRKCDEHLDCTITLKGKNVVEHSRTHPNGLPMPTEPVGIDDAVLSALADLLSTVENLGKRLKALEATVPAWKTEVARNQQRDWARLGAQETKLNTAMERTENLALTLGSTRADMDALTSEIEQVKHSQELTIGHAAATRADYKQTRAEVEAVRTEVSKALMAATQANDQFVKFGRMRDDLNKLINNQEHERSERLEATRKFQRSMRDVAHTIAER
jgi:chromosome segregation ATPase